MGKILLILGVVLLLLIVLCIFRYYSKVHYFVMQNDEIQAENNMFVPRDLVSEECKIK